LRQYCFARWRLASVVVCNTAVGREGRPSSARAVGQPTLHCRPVVLRPVRATACYYQCYHIIMQFNYHTNTVSTIKIPKCVNYGHIKYFKGFKNHHVHRELAEIRSDYQQLVNNKLANASNRWKNLTMLLLTWAVDQHLFLQSQNSLCPCQNQYHYYWW